MSRANTATSTILARRLAVLAAGVALASLLGACSMKTLSHPFGLGDRSETSGKAQVARASKPAKAAKSSKSEMSTKSAKSETSAPATPRGSLQEARERASAEPSQPYWPFHQAEIYAGADSTAKAEGALQLALARDPGYAPALSLLSRLWFRAGRNDEAIRMLEAAKADAARFPEGLPAELTAALALHYDAIGRRDLAVRTMAGLRRGRAGSVGVFVTMHGDDPDSASSVALALVREDPKSAANQNNAGIARLRAADPEGAEKAFQRAIEIDPSLPGPYYNLAILEKFYRLDDEAAGRWYRKYRERASDDPDGLAQVFAPAQAKPVAEKKDEP